MFFNNVPASGNDVGFILLNDWPENAVLFFKFVSVPVNPFSAKWNAKRDVCRGKSRKVTHKAVNKKLSRQDLTPIVCVTPIV